MYVNFFSYSSWFPNQLYLEMLAFIFCAVSTLYEEEREVVEESYIILNVWDTTWVMMVNPRLY